jgi:hypothetical protein
MRAYGQSSLVAARRLFPAWLSDDVVMRRVIRFALGAELAGQSETVPCGDNCTSTCPVPADPSLVGVVYLCCFSSPVPTEWSAICVALFAFSSSK